MMMDAFDGGHACGCERRGKVRNVRDERRLIKLRGQVCVDVSCGCCTCVVERVWWRRRAARKLESGKHSRQHNPRSCIKNRKKHSEITHFFCTQSFCQKTSLSTRLSLSSLLHYHLHTHAATHVSFHKSTSAQMQAPQPEAAAVPPCPPAPAIHGEQRQRKTSAAVARVCGSPDLLEKVLVFSATPRDLARCAAVNIAFRAAADIAGAARGRRADVSRGGNGAPGFRSARAEKRRTRHANRQCFCFIPSPGNVWCRPLDGGGV